MKTKSKTPLEKYEAYVLNKWGCENFTELVTLCLTCVINNMPDYLEAYRDAKAIGGLQRFWNEAVRICPSTARRLKGKYGKFSTENRCFEDALFNNGLN